MTEFDPQRGIDYPIIDGRPSSMDTGRAVFADAARDTDPALAGRIEATANWRKDYMPGVRDLVVSGLQVGGGTVAMCNDAMASLYERFRFTRDAQVTDIAEAFAANTEPA
ncbi:MAG: hypothetical protein OEV20_00575, partial [Actinomycetota bacterium]|nr:hypothetical protein [Actinomycetota bacterium]